MIFGILYSPVAASLSVKWRKHGRHIHRRIPAHVRHVHEQHVERDKGQPWVAALVMHHMHQAVGGDGRIPRIGLVDAQRDCRRLSIKRSSGPVVKPSGGPPSGRVRAGLVPGFTKLA